MKVYGFTKVDSEGYTNGRESWTELFLSEKDRNDVMYENYSDTFDSVAENYGFEKKDGKLVDANKNPKQTRKQFMDEIKDSRDVDQDIFGYIQTNESHIQYEPFCKEL